MMLELQYLCYVLSVNTLKHHLTIIGYLQPFPYNMHRFLGEKSEIKIPLNFSFISPNNPVYFLKINDVS